MSDIVRIHTGYTPRPLQQKFHGELKRFNVLVCHRRFGKTVFSWNEMQDRAIRNPMPYPQYAYIAPTYKQAKTIVWSYLLQFSSGIPYAEPNKSELTLYIHRKWRVDPVSGEPAPDFVKVMLLGADDPDSLRGLYLDGVTLDEYAQCDPIIWGEIVRPALADRGGEAKRIGVSDHPDYKMPWATFIGTPKGQNHFHKIYLHAATSATYCADYEARHDIAEDFEEWATFEWRLGLSKVGISMDDRATILRGVAPAVLEAYKKWRDYLAAREWYSAVYKASETGVLPAEEIESMMADMDDEAIQQELECSFTAAIRGSYFGQALVEATEAGRVGDYAYDPRYPVDTFWDIGVGDHTVIWFRQKIHGRFYYIDYFEFNGEGIPFYKQVIEAKANGVGVVREVKKGVSVIGRGYRYGRHVWPHDGGAQDFSTGNTRQETARKLGLVVEIGKKQGKQDGIDAARGMIKVCYFDKTNCERGLECLYNYQKVWDSKLAVFKNEPLHDWSSHGSDGFRYSALDTRDSVNVTFNSMFQNVRSRAIMAYDELTRT